MTYADHANPPETVGRSRPLNGFVPTPPPAEAELLGPPPVDPPVTDWPPAEPPAAGPPPVEPRPLEPEPAPAERSAVDRQRDRGYTQAADVAGLPMTEVVYWFALALAAGADVAAFHQVVSLILRDQTDALVWLMVLGLTAIALTLAHFAGRLARDVTAERGTASWKQVFACAVPWVALGLAAFAVRLIVADSSGGTTVDGVSVGGGEVGQTARQVSGAVLFLVLYTGSGAVAAFGEFLSRNPLRSGYRRALRAHNRALESLAQSQPSYERAVQVYRQHARSRIREEANWRAAREQRLAHADELKRYAAVLIAAALQSPPVTEGMTLPDRRPMPGSELGPPVQRAEVTAHAESGDRHRPRELTAYPDEPESTPRRDRPLGMDDRPEWTGPERWNLSPDRNPPGGRRPDDGSRAA